MNYGKQITKKAWLDLFPQSKNRILTRYQYRILDMFGKMPYPSRRAGYYSRIARALAGGYIYSIKLEINDYCNLSCKMCYVEKKKTDLPDELVYGLIDQLRGRGTRLEILGGEPLMRENITDIIRYAKTRAKVPFLSLYTNGTGATRRMAMELRQAGLDAALVTLVSHRQQVHDEFTGVPGSWEKTLGGIRELSEAGIATYTFTTVHRYNGEDFKNIYEFAKNELGVHALFYQYIPQKKDDPLMIPPAQWHRIKKWVLLDKNPEHAAFVRDFYMISGNACSGGNFVFTVKADGSVQPCPFIHNIPLGNIRESTIWKIFRDRFARTDLVTFKSAPEECRECVYVSICGGGCKAGNDRYSGGYGCKDPRCLGPFSEARNKEEIMADLPTFF